MSKIYKYSGIIGSSIVLLTIIIATVFYPNYSHLTQTISELNARGVASATAMNIGYTIGFGCMLILASYFTQQENIFAVVSGVLMVLALAFMLALNWFFPMDPWEGFRTVRDQIHNSIITFAVFIFLVSKLSAFIYFYQIKAKRLQRITLVLFAVSLVFALWSLWANINESEQINFAERGWMISFLSYVVLISYNLKDLSLVRRAKG